MRHIFILILFQYVRIKKNRISNNDRCFSVHFCDHIEKIAEDIARAAELPCVLGTAHLPKGYTPVTGVSPAIDTVKSGEYKVARGLYSNTKGDPSGRGKSNTNHKRIAHLPNAFIPELQVLIQYLPYKQARMPPSGSRAHRMT